MMTFLRCRANSGLLNPAGGVRGARASAAKLIHQLYRAWYALDSREGISDGELGEMNIDFGSVDSFSSELG